MRFRFGRVPPVEHLVLLDFTDADRNLDIRVAIMAAGLEQQDALGIAPLREAIARQYQDRHSLAVDPGDIVVTTGSSAAFQLAFLAAFEPGDRVALAAPGYPAYRNILTALGLEPVLIEVGPNAH
jgi:aspartate/methionine/tyrosine aminotransferase